MILYYIHLGFLYIYNICIYRLINTCDIFSLIGYFEQYMEYDPFFTQPELTNPWISDSPEMWEQEKLAYVINIERQFFMISLFHSKYMYLPIYRKEISTRRVKRWAFSLQELLQDPVGREQFIRFLDKEFSGENLKYV